MKKLNKIVLKFRATRIKSKTWPFGSEWTDDCNTIHSIIHDTKLPDINLPQHLDSSNIIPTKRLLLQLYHNLKALARIEEENITQQNIKYHINQRCLQYETAPGKMIQSALRRSRKTIVLNRLLINIDNNHQLLISDPTLIKQHVNNHFQNFAVPFTPAASLSDRWITQFAPKDDIDCN